MTFLPTLDLEWQSCMRGPNSLNFRIQDNPLDSTSPLESYGLVKGIAKKKKISHGELRWASGGHMFHLKAGWPGFFLKEPVHHSKEKNEADSRDTHEASDDKHPPYGQNDSHRLPVMETNTLSMKCTVYFLVQWFQFKLNVSRQTRN